jgi:predicted ArsR family transcriptional regulator
MIITPGSVWPYYILAASKSRHPVTLQEAARIMEEQYDIQINPESVRGRVVAHAVDRGYLKDVTSPYAEGRHTHLYELTAKGRRVVNEIEDYAKTQRSDNAG